jgi:hypothetical protein
MAEAVDPGLMDPSSAAERRLQQQLEVRDWQPTGGVTHHSMMTSEQWFVSGHCSQYHMVLKIRLTQDVGGSH